MKLPDRVVGAGSEIGSSLVHAVPALQGPAVRYATKLTGPRDRVLRWRATNGTAPFGNWAEIPGLASAKRRDPSTWGNVVLGIERPGFQEILVEGIQPAAAYLLGNRSLAMAGVNELAPEEDFLRPVTAEGVPDENGDFLGVVMRVGRDSLVAAIGTANARGRQFVPMETRLLTTVAEVPAGLYRV